MYKLIKVKHQKCIDYFYELIKKGWTVLEKNNVMAKMLSPDGKRTEIVDLIHDTVTYYFDGGGGTYPWTWYERMSDGNLNTYASTFLDGRTQNEVQNTCPGDDLGAISKVEIRAYGYGDGDDRIDLWVKGGFEGDEHELTMPSSPDWSVYADITNDSNAPTPWAWSDIVALDVDVEYDKVGKGVTMYCAKIEIRVTYEPPPPVGGKSSGYIF